MFSIIIRYADMGDINKSIHISEITGIVIIDEIELHLHSILQKEVLPKLIKKFPKVQFIITSHSPLFLLGMEEIFGKEGFEIFNLPNGEKIGTESFSEVYSFQIPIPEHRKTTPNICIEHYYTDDEIKREFKCVDGIIRRMYMGNEFNSKGIDIKNSKMWR